MHNNEGEAVLVGVAVVGPGGVGLIAVSRMAAAVSAATAAVVAMCAVVLSCEAIVAE